MNPFEYVDSVNVTKKDLMVDAMAEKAYNPFLVNRAMSYFTDTLSVAQDMNIRGSLDKRMQYDYLLNSVRKGKRYSKWGKKLNNETVALIQEYYGYSYQRANEAYSILSKKQIAHIKEVLTKGKE